MPSVKDLIVELTDILDRKKTGRLYVYLKHTNDTRVAHLAFIEGELRNIYSSDLDWRDSMSLVFTNTMLKILFVPGSGKTVEFEKIVPLDTLELIQLFTESNEDTSWTQVNEITSGAAAAFLVDGATEAVIMLIGDSGAEQVRKIMKKHSPANHPRQFLDACRDLVAELVGAELADEKFARLYRYGIK